MAQRTPWFWRSEFGCAKAPLATINLKTVKRSPRLTGNAAKVLLPLALSNGARLKWPLKWASGLRRKSGYESTA